MRTILMLLLCVLAVNVYAENPVSLTGVTLNYETMFASLALIAVGFGMALMSFHMGIKYTKWIRDVASPTKQSPRPQPQQGPPDHF